MAFALSARYGRAETIAGVPRLTFSAMLKKARLPALKISITQLTKAPFLNSSTASSHLDTSLHCLALLESERGAGETKRLRLATLEIARLIGKFAVKLNCIR